MSNIKIAYSITFIIILLGGIYLYFIFYEEEKDNKMFQITENENSVKNNSPVQNQLNTIKKEQIDTDIIYTFQKKDTAGIHNKMDIYGPVNREILIQVIEIIPQTEKKETDYADTLAAYLDINKFEHEKYFIEIWQSPLGLDGYKISGNRIITYGLDTIQEFYLKVINDSIILQAGKEKFLLLETSEIKPFRRVN